MNRPEEPVRQDFLRILTEDYGYPASEIETEFAVPRGSTTDWADIAVFAGPGRDPAKDVVGIIETKAPGEQDGRDQLKSYLTATSAQWGVWANGEGIDYYCKPPGQSAVRADLLHNIPYRGQALQDVGKVGRKSDLQPFGSTLLKSSFRRILNVLYSNTNISRREKLGNEMIKIIFAKIKDETTYLERPPEFRAGYGESPAAVKRRVDKLFKSVVQEYAADGVFERNERITLDAKGVAWVVGQLERGSLMDTPTDVVGDAFEVFAESKFVGEKGEFFTPRNVIDAAVKLVDPQPGETVCDPACGSGGFLIATMRAVWDGMANHAQWRGLPTDRLKEAQRRMAERCFYGIDKENDLVRIAKAYMAISGDGRSNVVQQNTLHQPFDFEADAKAKFVRGGGELVQFDCILTNPPYGRKVPVLIDESRHFDLGHGWSKPKGPRGWKKNKARKTDAYKLFVERCLAMLKDGGRMAIILPESALHGIENARVFLRHYITSRCRVLAVVDLPHNTFKPYCNAKTCMVVVVKGQRPTDDDPVVMASPANIGHDHRGRPAKDDMPDVLRELDDPSNEDNRHVFVVPWRDVRQSGHMVPRYFAPQRDRTLPDGRRWVSVRELIETGTLAAMHGHGSPSSDEKGRGDIPYIRVKDIVNWEMYRNPTTGVPSETHERLTRRKHVPTVGDVVFVRRGSYRIGTVAMASEMDSRVVLTRELLTLRVRPENEHGMTPYYLLALLSSDHVQRQIERLVFYDTTLPCMGERWSELELPMHDSDADKADLSAKVERVIERKWEAQREVQMLREQIGGIVT